MIDMDKVLIAVITALITGLGMWIMGWIRSFLAARLRVSTPVERRIKSLESFVFQQSELLNAVTDRQANHAKGLITLANAVKTGDQTKVNAVLDILAKSEDEYIKFLRSRSRPRPFKEEGSR